MGVGPVIHGRTIGFRDADLIPAFANLHAVPSSFLG
jgi:hypothetical protein